MKGLTLTTKEQSRIQAYPCYRSEAHLSSSEMEVSRYPLPRLAIDLIGTV